jgi:hydroxymethylpyrimidine pyrophosphatase-like HAD family hydrolase
MMSPLVFTDCDDTLFQTERKCPNGVSSGLKCMSTLQGGTASGFATKRQEAFLSWLRAGTVVPVTARSREVLARVDIEQAPAVCSNGGCIVTEAGEIDHEWHERLTQQGRNGPQIVDVYAAVTQGLSTDAFRHWVVEEGGLDLYIVIKSNQDDAGRLVTLAEECSGSIPDGWRVHANGNNLAFLPGWLNKRNAVAYLIEKMLAEAPDTPLIGIGDSISDVGFMDLCDFAVAPTSSQLWKSVIKTSTWVD